jgi:transcriptional regulator with XRE-family HTH domain
MTETCTNPKQLRKNLGAGIRTARAQRGLTLRQACALSGVSFGYWCEVERGEKQASFEVLDQICTALDISLQALFNFMFREN